MSFAFETLTFVMTLILIHILTGHSACASTTLLLQYSDIHGRVRVTSGSCVAYITVGNLHVIVHD